MAFLKTDSVKLLPESLVQQKGNVLFLNFNFVENNGTQDTTHESKEYKIGGIVFQVRVVTTTLASYNSNNGFGYNNIVTIYLNKVYIMGKNLTAERYKTYNLTCAELETKNRPFDVSTAPTWHLIGVTNSVSKKSIELQIELEDNIPSSFACLYDDTILTDFELRGDDGSVSVHRAVLAASSPVLKTMLEGTWKETSDGGVKIPNTSRATLQLLKQYLYLNILPDEGLENLLLLASCYMIEDLKEKCMRFLVDTLTVENVLIRTEFAVQHALKRLHVMILQRVQAGHLDVNKIECE